MHIICIILKFEQKLKIAAKTAHFRVKKRKAIVSILIEFDEA